MTPRAILAAVRARLGDRTKWAPGAWAHTASGPSSRPLSSLARSWSLLGACRVEASDATGEDWGDAYHAAAQALERAYGISGAGLMQRWECKVGHEAALALVDRALEMLDEEAGDGEVVR